MELNLKGKVVVITGGATGIGKACVDAFLEEGCKVAICSSTQKKVDGFMEEYKGKDVIAMVADVAKPEQMDAFAKWVHESFSGLDVWVNNAGIYPSGDLETMPLDEWRKVFDINVDGVLYGSRAAAPYFRKQKSGVIINGASFATIMPTAGRGAYGVTKAAVGHITKVMAAELAADNIRVVSYMPGFVATELAAEALESYGKYEGNKIKMQLAQYRYGVPEEIAPTVVFLASDGAKFITGTGISVDGGKYCVQNPYYAWE